MVAANRTRQGRAPCTREALQEYAQKITNIYPNNSPCSHVLSPTKQVHQPLPKTTTRHSAEISLLNSACGYCDCTALCLNPAMSLHGGDFPHQVLNH